MFGCRWRNVAATSWSTSPSTARARSSALCSPVARMTISRASRIVATPIVIASRGTLSSPKKSAAASCRVTRSSVTSRVRLSAPEPGSLNPMCPVRPMPRSWRSIPPAARIACLVAPALGLHLVARHVAPGDVHVLRRDVELGEEILPHEAVVGVDALRIHRVVLVEIERDHVGEAESFLAVHPDQLAVHPDRGRAGGQPEHRPVPAAVRARMTSAIRRATSRPISS